MRLIGNALNGEYFENLLYLADREELEGMSLAVAYVKSVSRSYWSWPRGATFRLPSAHSQTEGTSRRCPSCVASLMGRGHGNCC